jgi:tRNA G46 methylase TrmB
LIIEALIWRTDFPYFKQETAQKKFELLLSELKAKGYDMGKINILAEIVWLSDLSVTYMGSDPIRAWNRVTNLYDELLLPKLEAVSRTDSYFADFADTLLFQELIKMKSFPAVFKNRWNSIYQFFHEGNPSTLLIRTIANARKSFLRINMLLGNFKGDIIFQMANEVWSEFFIGIGEDQNEISYAKSKFAELEPLNASVFWGNPAKLLPNIPDASIDNFIINFPSSRQDILTNKLSFSLMISTINNKLTSSGTLQIITDIAKQSDAFNFIYKEILSKNFVDCSEDKSYFSSKIDLQSLPFYSDPYLMSFCRKQIQ